MHIKDKLQEATMLALQGKLLESKLEEKSNYTDPDLTEKYKITKIYNSEEEVPYELVQYKLGSDRRISEEHYQELLDFCKSLVTFDVLSNDCYHSDWDIADKSESVTITDHIYLNELSKQYKIETKIIAQYDLDHTELIKVENEFLGGNLIYFYKPAKVKVRIKAGSESSFASSNTLSAFKEFSLNEINDIKDFVISENERIASNVNPNDNHNLADEQFSDALYHNRLYNNN